MPVIIDNFHLNSAIPIDNRFVVGGTNSFYSNRHVIEHKYQGLRIWDLTPNDSGPYYWTGVTWSSENAIGVLVDGTTEENYIPVFTEKTVLGKSLLFQNTLNNIGIGFTGSDINQINPNTDLSNNNIIGSSIAGLHTKGNIKTNGYFVGRGNYIIDLNASNINAGSLSINRISNLNNNGQSIGPNSSFILHNNGSIVSWKDTNTLSVLNSTNSINTNIIDDISSPNTNFITFVQDTSGNLPIKVSSNKIQFKPNNGQLLLSDGSSSAPSYSFINNTNTGMYYNQGISIGINGNEITSTRTYGFVLNNRIYIPTTSNNTDVGYGIVWLVNGPSNDTNINDGFVYNGQRLNFYGIGSHIPDNTNTSSTVAGRGTYIAGYFGVDIFSGNRLKVKVDEYNDVTINSRLNIVNTFDTLGGVVGNNVVLSTIKNMGGSGGNNVVIKDWSVRADWQQTPITSASNANDWLTWKHHNGITIDGIHNTPNGPNGSNITSGTLTFWERHPYIREQYFGSNDKKTLTINSGDDSQFVKVNGNIYNVRGNSFIGTYSVVSTKTIEDILNNNLPKTIKTGMFDIGGESMYTATPVVTSNPNTNNMFHRIPIFDNNFANYLKWIEIPYNSSELTNVGPSSFSYWDGTNHETLDNYYSTNTPVGTSNIGSGRARYDSYGNRNSFQQGWHNIKGYKVFTITQRGNLQSGGKRDSRFKIVMYKDPAYIADFNSGKLTEWKLEKNFNSVSAVYGGIGNDSSYNILQICPSYHPIPTYFMNQPGMSHLEIYINEYFPVYQDIALVMGLQRRSVSVEPIMNTNLPGVSIGTYTGI